MALDTVALFNRVFDALTEYVGSEVDHMEWFEDEDPALAVQLASADLHGEKGQSLLFGTATTAVEEREGAGSALAEIVPVWIILVRIRTEDSFTDGQALNDLQDRVMKLFSRFYEPKREASWYGATSIELHSRGPLVQAETWMARQLRYDFTVTVVPTDG